MPVTHWTLRSWRLDTLVPAKTEQVHLRGRSGASTRRGSSATATCSADE